MISSIKASQTSLVRTGLGRETALFIASVVGAATLFRSVRRRRGNRRRQLLARQSAQQHQTSDRAQDWADGTGAVPPASVSAEQLVLLDEILPLTPKQIWRLIYDMAFIQAFYKKKMYRETGIGGWQKTGPHTSGKTCHYITPVKQNVIGPREAYTEEEYSCQTRGPGGFVVHVCAYTRQVPYGKSFHVELCWTASRSSNSTTRLQIVGTFVPEKRMLGIGGIIRKATKEGLMETYNLYRQHLLDSLPGYTDEAGQGMPLDSKAASRSNSAISKEAAEDLVRNGIFVSWGQLLWAILILACTIATARLALDGSMQAMARGSWRRKLQHASAMLQD